MKLGIIGHGIVGSATAHAFCGHDVRCWDVAPGKATHHLSEAMEADLVFVCLPTPQREGELRSDLSALEHFFSTATKFRNYVLRSTVPVGTTRRIRETYGILNVVHWPEFLTMRTAKEDAVNPRRNVVGSPTRDGLTEAGCELANLLLEEFPKTPLHTMSSDESEAVKLFQNAFSACKVSIFNELRTFADKRGLDWNRVLEALLAGGWINPAHTAVPGADGLRGWGGSCFPKDLASLESQMTDDELLVTMLTAARIRNEEDRKR